MKNIKDLVSVIIPTYNRAELIARSVQSILKQTYKNIELIIVDDGSTDNTEEIVKKFDDSRVIYIKQENQGACAARNNGIDYAKGEFIAFQDSDDVWHEDKLEKQINCLKGTGADMCFCCMRQINDHTCSEIIGNKFKNGFISSSVSVLGIGTQSFCAYSYVFKTEKFDDGMPRLQDFEIMIRIQRKFKIYYMDVALVDYYIQDDSISSNPKKLVMACEMILNKHNNNLTKECRKEMAFLLLRDGFLLKSRCLQINNFNLAYKLYPFWQTKARILAYKFGVYWLYKKVKHL